MAGSRLDQLRLLGADVVAAAQPRITQAGQALQTGLQQAHQQLQESSPQYAQIGAQMRTFIKDRAKLDMKALKDAGYGLPAMGPRWEAAKREGQIKLLDLGGPARARVMFGLNCAVKSAVSSDPDMCECVRSWIQEGIDVIWSDLTVFVEQMFEDQRGVIQGRVANSVEELGEIGDPPMSCGPRWWRARFLYHYLPYDRSIFGQLKDPIWWVLLAVSLVPFYGIRVAFFALILLLILCGAPPDQYQLVGYIIGFKGSQFISSGVMQACVAGVRYYLCVHPGGRHTCDVDGPGANQDLVTGLVDLLGSTILTWAAFLSLPYSVRSAGIRDVVAADTADTADTDDQGRDEPAGCCGCMAYNAQRGGRLAGLLRYDVVCFLLSCCLLAFLTYVDASHLRPGEEPAGNVDLQQMLSDANTWQGHTAIFWARIFYALLSLPFLVFLIPGLDTVLTHTTATGYNRHGLCVPFMLHEMPDEKSK